MKKTNFEKVTEFNAVMGQGIPDAPCVPSPAQQKLRLDLIMEEAIIELKDGLEKADLELIADAIGDGLVVIYGAANDCGMDADIILAEIHRSNMSKLCNTEEEAEYAVERYAAGDGYHGKYSPIRADYRPCQYPGLEDKFVVFNADTGKTLKGPNFREPDMKSVISTMISTAKSRQSELKADKSAMEAKEVLGL